MPDAWREHWEGTLAEAEQLLAGIPTCAEAQRARDQVSACEGQWKEKVTAGWKLAVLEGHTDSVRAIAFSPDGATLASGAGDYTVRLWDVASGGARAVLRVSTGWVTAIAFSPDGTTLAFGGTDSRVRLWEVASGVRGRC